MSENPRRVCAGGEKLIFACSGAADTAEIADRAARRLSRQGTGQMFCLAGIGGRVEPIMDKTRASDHIVAIDGCDLDCARRCLELAGIDGVRHLRLNDLGMEKGKSPLTAERLAQVVSAAEEMMS
jgi:uncharacterized metal-binding protein